MKPNTSGIGSGVGPGVGVATRPKAAAPAAPRPDQSRRAPAVGKMRNAPMGSSGQFPKVTMPIPPTPSPRPNPNPGPNPGPGPVRGSGPGTNSSPTSHPARAQTPAALPRVAPPRPSTPKSNWSCVSCGKVLGPQSVQQGNSVILEGRLLCVSCVRSKPSRRAASPYSTRALVTAGFGSLVVLVLVSIFFPSHVLFALLLLSVALVGVGVLGASLNRFVRLGVLAGGVGLLALSAFGLMTLRERASEKIVADALALEQDEVRSDLKNDCLLEAQRRIEALETKAAHGSGVSPERIAELKGEVNAWIRQAYGDLNMDERALLFALLRKFGSRTNAQSRRVRALKLDGETVQLTLALDASREDAGPQDRVLNLKDGPQSIDRGVTANPTLNHAHEILLFLVAQRPTLAAVVLKLENGTGAELITLNLDRAELDALKLGETEPLTKHAAELAP